MIPKSPLREFCYVILWNSKTRSKFYECVIMQVIKGAPISAWKRTKSLWGRVLTGPAEGAYSAPPRTAYSWI